MTDIYRALKVLILAILLAAVSAACSAAPFQMLGGATRTPAPAPTLTDTPGPTVTPTVDLSRCAYVWSNRSQPELTQQLNQAFQDAGMREVEAQASAYGEDCLNPDTNTVVAFSALQTDFYINVRVASASDGQAMGEWTEKVTRVVDQLPQEGIPGPNKGQISLTFDDGAQKVTLWFPRARAKELIESGMRGSELFEALRAQ
jgi:hypothetical protein